jgi:hypothetical protein
MDPQEACGVKVRFWTRKEARRFGRLRGLLFRCRFRPYPCPYCDGYHLTTIRPCREGAIEESIMKQTMVPGTKAKHCVITDTCRSNRGDNEAINEALRRIREEYLACVDGWPVGKGVEFHVVLTVKRPEEIPE